MAKLPPQPVGVAPGSSYWNDWYEKLRRFVEQATTSVAWTAITGTPTTLAGYGITDGQTTLNNSADLAAALGDETGTGVVVFNNNPTLINPVLGTPASVNLSNATNLPVGSITGMGAGVATFLATPSSANLAAAVTGETGTGALVFATSPTLVTPVLGVATATSLKALGSVTLTPGTSGTSMGLSGTFPQFGLSNSAAAADNRLWDTYADTTTIHHRIINDALSVGTDYLTSTRSGTAVLNVVFPNGSIGVGVTPSGTYKLEVNGSLSVSSTTMIRTGTSFTNGAGAAAGTLTNAPTAGNPTKWVPINDNGTIRYIPAW